MLIAMNKLTTEGQTNTQWILSDLMAALHTEIRVPKFGFHSPFDQVPDTSISVLFQVNDKDSKDCSNVCSHINKKKGLVSMFWASPYTHT